VTSDRSDPDQPDVPSEASPGDDGLEGHAGGPRYRGDWSWLRPFLVRVFINTLTLLALLGLSALIRLPGQDTSGRYILDVPLLGISDAGLLEYLLLGLALALLIVNTLLGLNRPRLEDVSDDQPIWRLLDGLRLAEVCEGLEGVRIPRVYLDRSAKRVMTLEYVDGVKATQLAALDAAGVDRDEVARRLIRAMIKQVLVDGFFHGDSHPGHRYLRGLPGLQPGGRPARLQILKLTGCGRRASPSRAACIPG